MKRLISIFFILLMCGPLLPAFDSMEQQEVVLFTATEEEHNEQSKEKKDIKAFATAGIFSLSTTLLQATFPFSHSFILDAPTLGNPTPPPDNFC